MIHIVRDSRFNGRPDRARPLQSPLPGLRQNTRLGFSLIEIIVAMAICLLGLAAILQMSNLSQTFARKAADAVEQQILCQNRINEVLAGLVPLDPVSEGICPENIDFGYSLSLEPHEQLPLVLLEVSVRPIERDSMPAAKSKSSPSTERSRRRDQREREVTLRRWLALPNGQVLPSSVDSPARETVAPLPPDDSPSVGNEEGDN